MVAISLYRGNLHNVADVPRRWLMPPPKISHRDFKTLFHRRSKALSRLRSTTTTSNPNSNHNEKTPIEPKLEDVEEETVTNSNVKEEAEQSEDCKGGGDGGASSSREDEKDDGGLDGADFSMKPADDAVNGEPHPNNLQKPDDLANNPNMETMSNANELGVEKEKRKREIEDKLQVLNAKKHNLVKALKQILNVEEELQRRNSTQGMPVRPSVQLQVDVSNDSGSFTRHLTPRMGSDANPGGDIEGGEAEDISNHNTHSRHIHRMSSTSPSPSSESPLRRPPYIQHNVVPHPSRSGLGNSGSPSRFAPMGLHGHPANLPTLSVSGTNYVASSPSPAASGGTSAFKDARHPSPWN
ncbi:TRNA (ILE)-LYSIDINE SYNTHASE [Salix viminalis]|uniref:tRNA (ILE)-LYSIDINE SYNTHASE n=1 Tax=Salix viminalis TaxID=40686 RepID=A0A9Q0NMR7_SALVM|nr:TRNA (ILE)-LYSIDINE SYNTHASE [Salix viminalis]